MEASAGHEVVQALLDEQAALRRVATLVAEAGDTARVFPIVTEEVGRLLAAQTANIVVRVEEHGDHDKIPLHQVLDSCARQYPHLARWLPHVRVAVNQEYSATDCLVSADDEIALLPPVAGGSM